MTTTPPLKRKSSGVYSQYRGVTYDAINKSWRTYMIFKSGTKRPKSLGYFSTEREAAKAWDRAARPYGKRCNLGPTFPKDR